MTRGTLESPINLGRNLEYCEKTCTSQRKTWAEPRTFWISDNFTYHSNHVFFSKSISFFSKRDIPYHKKPLWHKLTSSGFTIFLQMVGLKVENLASCIVHWAVKLKTAKCIKLPRKRYPICAQLENENYTFPHFSQMIKSVITSLWCVKILTVRLVLTSRNWRNKLFLELCFRN